MPARSQAQFRYMQAVAHGSIKGRGLSKDQATEFVQGQSPEGLPKYASRSIAYNEKRKKK